MRRTIPTRLTRSWKRLGGEAEQWPPRGAHCYWIMRRGRRWGSFKPIPPKAPRPVAARSAPLRSEGRVDSRICATGASRAARFSKVPHQLGGGFRKPLRWPVLAGGIGGVGRQRRRHARGRSDRRRHRRFDWVGGHASAHLLRRASAPMRPMGLRLQWQPGLHRLLLSRTVQGIARPLTLRQPQDHVAARGLAMWSGDVPPFAARASGYNFRFGIARTGWSAVWITRSVVPPGTRCALVE
jgi:hypothetical protein